MRRHLKLLFRFILLIAALYFPQAPATADTIVLKNGRRIIAFHVVEEGDKVKYQTSAGELSLPKSIVDHIERGGSAPAGMGGGSSAAAVDLGPPSADPAITATDGNDVERSAVRDGSIDRNYIAQLETAARSGGKEANLRAAIAHHAAAQFELAQGDMEHALGDEKTALIYEPEEPALLMYTGYLYLRRSEYKQALDYLDRAKRFAPNNADQAALSGWAYEGLNKLGQAVAEYQRSYALRPDPSVKAALDKALRDKNEEDSYKENESAHFNLKYNGSAEPALARDVLRTLESHFQAIESELNYTPPEPINVILYTREAFADITRAPGWVGALNDGRIRVPVQGLTEVDAELSRVLKHELTHSFVRQKTQGNVPTWLNEGLAQWMEGKRSSENGTALVQTYNAGRAPQLSELEGSWMRLGTSQAGYAYAWGLANTEYIIQSGGMGDIERILDRLASGESTEAALREVLHSDYGDLMKSTAEYLGKTYGR